ncbi:PD40 domain-containing protein [Vibrio coralliilyticus]|uniref:PD40 domain-containing protein n=1 Tax=Vibrio coralliilyticus TaxID=190893 RepID=UPI00148BE595|nr:PD40 domain-containing protein [Vibrio coralliilyticus]NOI28195.1 hypothetical protein [Vibrio coralliilyticus]NOI49136.1 hypothetical protein [Vibrio coralliilyticus]WFB47129.1 PD40 domain-containing protein [Vibrio coralliilyticus]
MRILYFAFLALLTQSAYTVEFDPELLSENSVVEHAPYSVDSDSDSIPSKRGLLGEPRPLSTAMTRDNKYVVFNSSDKDLVSEGVETEWFIKNTENYELKPLGRPSLFTPRDLMSWVKISPNGRYIGFSYNKNGVSHTAVWDRMIDKLTPAEYDENKLPYIQGKGVYTSTVYPINERIVMLSHTLGKFSITDLQNKVTKKVNIDIYGNEAKLHLSAIRPFSDDGRYTVYVTHNSQMDSDNVSDVDDQTLYLYDRIEGKHTKISSFKYENYALGSASFGAFSISPDGKYVVYVARRPSSPEYSHYDFYQTYLVLYNIATKKYEYVKDINEELIQAIKTPSVSNDAESLAFSTRNSDYLALGSTSYQVVYFDRIHQQMIQPSVSQRTGKATSQRVFPMVYGNGNGILWSGHGPGLLEGEDSQHHLYIMGPPSKPIVPEICLPYIN